MRRSNLTVALLFYAAVLAVCWVIASHSILPGILGGIFGNVFAGFALILVPLIGFGFGLAEWLRERLPSKPRRIAAAGLFVVPYLVSSLPAGNFDWRIAGGFVLLPVGLAVVFEVRSVAERPAFGWEDLLALAALACPIVFHWFASAWPQPGLSGLPKLLLTDVALYLYLVVRRLPRIGYDFHPQVSDLTIGAREWLFFAPIAIVLGLALGFLHWHAIVPAAGRLLGGLAFTIIFIAVPEELFFRGLLLNLLETRLPPLPSLLISAVLFGLAHFNKGAAFNWRYVLLAVLAGIFYGRAWRHQHRIVAAAITHTLVDVTWSLWFH